MMRVAPGCFVRRVRVPVDAARVDVALAIVPIRGGRRLIEASKYFNTENTENHEVSRRFFGRERHALNRFDAAWSAYLINSIETECFNHIDVVCLMNGAGDTSFRHQMIAPAIVGRIPPCTSVVHRVLRGKNFRSRATTPARQMNRPRAAEATAARCRRHHGIRP
jgi:hypothetical protein